jgi:Protein of unknown function (DUF2927)
MLRALLILLALTIATAASAASGRRPAPEGAFKGAPGEYTRFSGDEIARGFMALAFGSDLHLGAATVGLRRFDHPIRARVIGGGSVDRKTQMERILEEFARKVPSLNLTLVPDTEASPADIEVRLINEEDFASALRRAFGASVAQDFIRRTDPQCMTSVTSATTGAIERAISFVIVDKGNDVFLDCAYHEPLHAFGLSNHDQRNPWTTLNQNRMVGYFSVYDRALLTLLYDPRITPGMSREQARTVLRAVIADLGLATPAR